MREFPIRPLVYLITEGTLTTANFETRKEDVLAIIRTAASSNIPLVQIREKSLNAAQLFELCTAAVTICRDSKTRIIVNDRFDVALAAGASGVHLPSNGLPAAAVRRKLPDGFVIGVSAHSIEDVLSASKGGADFAVYSPVFESPGKGPALGIITLRACVEAAEKFPVIALGGIDVSNYISTLHSGAAGFAAIRFLNDTANLKVIGNEFFRDTNEQ